MTRLRHVPRSIAPLAAGLLLGVLVALASLTASAAVDPLPFKDRAQEVRFQNLTRQLRCLVCQNESLNDSSALLAADLRHDIFRQMQAGKSDDEIKAWLTARYGDFVLYDPPVERRTWLLWFGPFVVLAIGAGTVVAIVRRRRRAVPAVSTPTSGVDDGEEW